MTSAPLFQSIEHQELVEALAMTTERETFSGSPWLPTFVAEQLVRIVRDRDGRKFHMLVPFLKVAASCSRGDYIRFFYMDVPMARTAHFRHVILKAQAAGRLAKNDITLTEEGVTVRDGATGKSFSVNFANMPLLTALLDVLHNSLGYQAVAAIVEPYIKGMPGRDYATTANALFSAFNEWLAPRLTSGHHHAIARSISDHLESLGWHAGKDEIGDAEVLSFWCAASSAEKPIDGVKLWRKAVIAVLRYARSLEEARARMAYSNAAALGGDRSAGEVDPTFDEVLEAGQVRRSPVAALHEVPLNAVKWLDKNERSILLNSLAGPHPTRAKDDGEIEAADDHKDESAGPLATGLAGSECIDARFALTLLRVDVFEPIQNALIQRLRQKVSAPDAIEASFDRERNGDYEQAIRAYADISAQFELIRKASLHLLLRWGDPEAYHLVREWVDDDTLTSWLQSLNAVDPLSTAQATSSKVVQISAFRSGASKTDDLSDRRDPFDVAAISETAWEASGSFLKRAFEELASRPETDYSGMPPAVETTLRSARAAFAAVNRQGFRPKDRTDPAMRAAFVAAPEHLLALAKALSHLMKKFESRNWSELFESDRDDFFHQMSKIYNGEGVALPLGHSGTASKIMTARN